MIIAVVVLLLFLFVGFLLVLGCLYVFILFFFLMTWKPPSSRQWKGTVML